VDFLELGGRAALLPCVEDDIVVDLEFLEKPEDALGLGVLMMC